MVVFLLVELFYGSNLMTRFRQRFEPITSPTTYYVIEAIYLNKPCLGLFLSSVLSPLSSMSLSFTKVSYRFFCLFFFCSSEMSGSKSSPPERIKFHAIDRKRIKKHRGGGVGGKRGKKT